MPMSKSAAAVFIVALLAAPAANAQAPGPVPDSQQKAAQATTGATDVTGTKTVTVEKAADKKDATELQVQAGGMSSEGNARALALTGGSKFRFRRDDNQFRAALAANYAASAAPAPADRDYTSTVQNFQGMARYDRFFGDVIAFMQGQARNDRFAGYDARLQLDPGLGYAFINTKTVQFTGEGGYDLMYQKNRTDARYLLDANKLPVRDASGAILFDPNKPDSYTVHSARAAANFDYVINDATKLSTMVEYLQGISDTSFYRLNFDAALTAKLGKALSFSFGESIRFDNNAAKLGKAKTDYMTSASLVYSFL